MNLELDDIPVIDFIVFHNFLEQLGVSHFCFP